MRKTLIQTLLAAFCALSMEGRGMNIAARNAMLVKGGYTAKDYVQNGLIAMWDGIENAGWGRHDGNATMLVDLMGNFPSLTISSMQGNEALVGTRITPYTYQENITTNWNTGHPYTHEILYRTSSYVTEDFIPHIIYESYPYRQNDYFMWASPVAQDGTRNKIWFRTYNYPPRIQTGLLHTISMANEGTGINGAKMMLNGISLPLDIGYQSTQSIRHIATLARVNIRYNMYYGCIRFYSRALTASEIAANYAVDKARFNLP